MRRVAALCAIACLLPAAEAQTGWDLTGALTAATDVVVADMVQSSGTWEGGNIHERATVRVARVLQGDLPVGSDIALDWSFPADFSVHAGGAARITATGALFLLRKREGSYEPLPWGETPAGADRFLTSARKAAPTGALAYPEEAPLEVKVAREEASVLESFSTKHENDLKQNRGPFLAIVQRFRSFPANAVGDVYRYFASSPNIYLRTFGLEGAIRAGDADAAVELEADASRLAPAFDLLPVTEAAMSIEPRAHLAAAHALARLALNETDFGNLDGMAPGILGRAGSLEMLPYLTAMLGNPNPLASDGAVFGICELLRPASGLWDDEMTAHCPLQSPARNAEDSETNHRFWLDWWGTHRDEIAKTVNLPAVRAPSRYSAAARAAITAVNPRTVDNAVEIRFGQMLHTASMDPAFELPEDREIFARMKIEARKHVEEHMREDRKRLDAAREKHIAIDSPSLEAGYDALLKTELAEVRNRLSSGGWITLEQALTAAPAMFGGAGAAFGTAAVPVP